MIVYDHEMITTNYVTLHVVLAGPREGTPVILLHGFPEFWYGWRHQIDFLAERGYRVIVPDQRGYNTSEKPQKVEAYRIGELARDVVGLMDALGYSQTYLVGHDWGAAVAWWVATRFPERLKKLAILNVPYPTLVARAYREGNMQQTLKSWYIFFFQIPWLPERLLSANSTRGLEQALRGSSKPDTFSEQDYAEYRNAWAQPGAVTGMLNWYRAARYIAGRSSGGQRGPLRISVPTLILWGEQDVALEKSLAQKSVEICENGQLIFFPNATHWVQHDESEAVNQHLAAFLIG
ncbi:MAG: alpha/beta hydrolase [Anaerolineae bacterium]|nr:alpha/beta hydrolase [Anaerolineae bacterium]